MLLQCYVRSVKIIYSSITLMVRFRVISQCYSRWVWGFFEKVKPHLWPLWHLTFYSYKRTICSLLESILFLLASFQGWYLLCFPGTLCPTRGLAIPSRSIRSEWVPPCHPARVWLRPRTTRGRWYRTKPILPVSSRDIANQHALDDTSTIGHITRPGSCTWNTWYPSVHESFDWNCNVASA